MRPLNILTIDDDPLLGQAISAFIVQLGHTGLYLDNGSDGLEHYRTEAFDLVLVDRLMPGMDGLQTTRQLRALQQDSGWRPIIMLSASNAIDEQVLALNSGCDDFLTKPINFSILEAKINSFWRIAQMQQQISRQNIALLSYANLEAEEKRISNFLMERLVRREQLQHPAIEHYLQPASLVSGDLLLVSTSRSGDIYVMLADATGHGLPAALTLIPLSQTFYAMAAKGFQLRSIVQEMNTQHRAYSPPERFVAALAACYRSREGTLEVWNGGIPSAVLLSNAGEVLWRFHSHNLPLGIVDNQQAGHEVETMHLTEEAQLFMFSDGLIEAENAAGEAFGKQRLEQALHRTAPDQRLLRVRRAVTEHLQQALPHDDLSCLQLSCREALSVPKKAADSRTDGAGTWGLQLLLTAAQLKRLDLEPLISDFCQQLGLDNVRQGLFRLILRELLGNALDHGILGLESSIKHDLDGFERYLHQRQERLAALEAGEIRLQINQISGPDSSLVSITVSDSGPGFDHAALAFELPQSDLQLYHGRGLQLLKGLCSRLEFMPPGNQVLAEFRWEHDSTEESA
ncbi:ATP-binding SpoIIE family protein phosphatase [Pseudomonas sp. N040]|uniref:ATP-binding SpoIIE family protein phosphatase n=1 Tax=Pseudomonas sp. N040 TaxID=2785325 RepID=UPI0018A2C40B|nr:SpoIIE family protein phosphatase [Pseudomonas sp. N040]MBF7728555.1 SpoIIE family protein phosphatase [Pseudomonas sp. N040]MBW7012195.1 SpoIIE family protein phosphatase [Pseudomonas sp. N040]